MALRYGPQRARKRRPFKARRYQSRSDPTRKLAESHKPAIKAAVLEALKALRASVDRRAIAAKVRARDFAGAADVVNLESFKHRLKAAFRASSAAFEASGHRTAKDITQTFKRRLRKDTAPLHGGREQPDQFSFDLYTDEVLEQLSAYQDEFIDDLTDDMRSNILEAVTSGVREGLEPEEVAQQIRDDIGLTERMANAVDNYRSALEDGSSRALDYALRDDEGDEDVQAAIDGGYDLDDDRIDDLVDAYADRALDYRADTIAGTESNRAANMGLQAAYAQAIDQGTFKKEAVRQFWMLAEDERVCDECNDVADSNEDGVAIGDSFDSSEGPIEAPPLHPACRCSIEIRTNLDMVDAESDSGDDEGDEAEAEL